MRRLPVIISFVIFCSQLCFAGGLKEPVVLDLTQDSELTAQYLGEGWWDKESDARWTGKDGKDPEILIPVEEGYGYDLVYEILWVPFDKIKGDYQTSISVNGEVVKTLTADEISGSLEFSIPDKFLQPGKTVKVVLHTPFFCPKELGESEDARTLGLKIKEVHIVPHAKAKKVYTGKEKPIGILKDKLPVKGAASSPDFLAQLLKDAGYRTSFLKAVDLANPQIFDRDNFDIVTLPYGASFPADARENFLRYLCKGGSFISMGGYTFDNLCGLGPSEEIVSNTGFEDGLDGWTIGAPPGVTIAQDAGISHSGKASCMIEVPEGAQISWHNIYYKFSNVQKGENISGSVYIKTKDVRDGAGAYIAFNYYKEDGSRISWVDGGFVTGTSDWVYRSIEGQIPAGTAYVNFVLLLNGYGQAWFDDVKVEKTALSMNTHKAKAADFLEIKTEQIGVFDPSYLLEHVKYAKANPEQYIIDADIRDDGNFTGYAAIGVTGDNWYCGAKDRSRWIPLVFAYDTYGRNRGAIGAVMPNYRGLYKGSVWVYFGVDNEDLFNAKHPKMCVSLVDIVKAIKRKTFLHETKPEYHCYYPGEEVKIETKISNFGDKPQNLELKVNVLPMDSNEILFEDRKPISIESDETKNETFVWKPGQFITDVYRIKTYLVQNGKTIDCEDFNGFVAWNEKIARERQPLILKDNYFNLEGKPSFMIGAQELWATASLRNGSAITIAEDYRTMRDYGIRFSRSFMMGALLLPEAEKRFRDAMVYLCQKHGVVMFFEGISECSSNRDVLQKGLKRAEEVAQHYKGIPLFTIDFRNEPSIKFAGSLSDVWGDLNSYKTNLSALNLMRDWAKNLADKIHEIDPQRLVAVGYLQGNSSAEVGKDPVWASEGLDFNNRHFYGPLPNFPPEFKEIDMRYQGKPPSEGEFGSKTHPAGGYNFETKEDQLNRYLFISHYVFGLGGVFVSNWHWRDPWENIFPYGVIHPDLVPKDVLKVYRNVGLLFNSCTPVYEPPSVYYLLPDNHRISYYSLYQALYNGLNQLMDCHLDYGVINEANLGKLPADVKVIIYPLPFMPDDATYEKLKDFVSKGGILYISGDISYENSTFERTKTSRLEELCGVKFLEENYKGIPKGMKFDREVRPLSDTYGLKVYDGSPCIKVKPLTAGVIAQSADGPVTFVNNFGSGRVFYTTDLVELNNQTLSSSGIYRAFLNFAGVRTNSIVPDDPKVHLFKVKTTDGAAYVLYNRRSENVGPRCNIGADLIPSIKITLASNKPGFLHLSQTGEIFAIESQGEVKQGDKTLLQTNVHMMVFSLDGKSISTSKEIAIFPMGSGSITIGSNAGWSNLTGEVGEFSKGKWVTLEKIKPVFVQNDFKIDINNDQAFNIILIGDGDLTSAEQKISKIAGF